MLSTGEFAQETLRRIATEIRLNAKQVYAARVKKDEERVQFLSGRNTGLTIAHDLVRRLGEAQGFSLWHLLNYEVQAEGETRDHENET